jgi:hypothetical protein
MSKIQRFSGAAFYFSAIQLFRFSGFNILLFLLHFQPLFRWFLNLFSTKKIRLNPRHPRFYTLSLSYSSFNTKLTKYQKAGFSPGCTRLIMPALLLF